MATPIQYLGSRGQAIKTPRAQGATSKYGWGFEVSEKDLARVRKKFQRASGRSLYTQLQRANLAAGDTLATRIKQAAPRATGTLRKSVKVRAEGRKAWWARGKSTTVLVGPTARGAPHRHLVILGTKIRPSAKGGRYWHGKWATNKGKTLARINGSVVTRTPAWNTGRMKPNPFVDRAARGFGPKAAALIMREWRTLLR